MKQLARLGLLGLTLLLAACGSTPQSSYYHLSSKAGGGESNHPALGIGPIKIPEYLNRNAMVFKRGDNQLHIANFQRWAEPLEEGISRVMSLNLAGFLDTQNIRRYPWSRSETPDYGIQVWILSLDMTASEAVLLAEWRLNKPHSGSEVLRRIGHYKSAVKGADGAAMSESYSLLLEKLSQDIADSIASDMASGIES